MMTEEEEEVGKKVVVGKKSQGMLKLIYQLSRTIF